MNHRSFFEEGRGGQACEKNGKLGETLVPIFLQGGFLTLLHHNHIQGRSLSPLLLPL